MDGSSINTPTKRHIWNPALNRTNRFPSPLVMPPSTSDTTHKQPQSPVKSVSSQDSLYVNPEQLFQPGAEPNVGSSASSSASIPSAEIPDAPRAYNADQRNVFAEYNRIYRNDASGSAHHSPRSSSSDFSLPPHPNHVRVPHPVENLTAQSTSTVSNASDD